MRMAKMALLCASMLMPLANAYAGEPKPLPQAEQKSAQPQPQAKKAAEKAAAKAAAKDSDDADVDGVKLRAVEASIVSLTNEQRVRYGLPALQVDEGLMQTAREHAAWMTRNHSLVHTALAVAENIAMGQAHSGEAVQSWMNSPGHRANILNPNHRHIGVAAFRTESGTIFWCQQFRQ